MTRRSQTSSRPHGRPAAQRPLTAVLAALLILAALAACSGPSSDGSATKTPTATASGTSPTATAATSAQPTATRAATPTTGSSPTATAVPTKPGAGTATPVTQMTVSAYFLRNEKIATAHRQIPQTIEVGTAALQELLKGPTDTEKSAGLSTSVPAGTRLLSLAIANQVAIVNLSKEFESGGGSLSMSARLAQVVYTLTQFPTVTRVSFQLEGQPVKTFGGEGIMLDQPAGRANFEDLTPAIFVESPAVGDSVKSPIHVWGTANTFEATFQLNVLDRNGKVLADQVVTATSGTGTRGTFDVSVSVAVDQTGPGKLVVFELSAKDGSRTNVVEIPITLTK